MRRGWLVMASAAVVGLGLVVPTALGGPASASRTQADLSVVASGFTEYPLPAGQTLVGAHSLEANAWAFFGQLAAGPDGVWFPQTGGVLGELKPDGEFSHRAVGSPDGLIQSVAGAADGSIWFNEPFGHGGAAHPVGGVGRVKGPGPATFTTLTNPNTSQQDGPLPGGGIAIDPEDSSAWVAGDGFSGTYRVSPGGSTSSFYTNTAPLNGIAFGGDGALWGGDCSSIVQVCQGIQRLTTSGASTHYALPCMPMDMTTGPGGAFVAGCPYHSVATIDGPIVATGVSSAGTITYYLAPSSFRWDGAGITFGDNAFWLTNGDSQIYRLTQSGLLYAYQLPGETSHHSPQPHSIVVGHDGVVWFDELGDNAIGRLDPAAPPSRCTHALGVTVPLHEAAVPGQHIKNIMKFVTSLLGLDGTLGDIAKVALIATPVGEEYVLWITLRSGVKKVVSVGAQEIARDPPDSQFDKLPVLRHLKLPRLRHGRGMSSAAARTLNALLSNEAEIGTLQVAYLAAVERAQGAEIAHDNTWVVKQDDAAAQFAHRLAAAYARAPVLEKRAASVLRHSPLAHVQVTRSIIRRGRRLSRKPLLRATVKMLHQAGFTSAQIAQFHNGPVPAKIKPGTLARLLSSPALYLPGANASNVLNAGSAYASCLASA